ncbi:alpha/beta hydrolase [uncultured Anaerococcus sp.]|uniref:alpha/beta hydrolase n=1 Tax=uncultured Anaerococcus sp. TaxID=293428 RepID=UPI002615EF23|nr:alpha/beta hydrolase [uncultured Anaerococcus sp.]
MQDYINSFDDTRLFLNKEIMDNSKAVIVIVHGLAEHSGRYDYLANKLHESSISTYRFDHRGHGKSDGERGYYSDFNEIVDDTYTVVKKAIDENPNLPVFVLGHSMGGYAVSLFAAKYNDLKLAGIITSGAVTSDEAESFRNIPTDLDPLYKINNTLGPGVCSVTEVVENYEKDPLNLKKYSAGLVYALLDGLEWYKDKAKNISYSALLMHGYDDGLVSYKDTLKNFNAISSKDLSLKLYKNLYHEILNEWKKDEVIADIINWIEFRI